MLGPFFSKKKSKNKQESKAKQSLFGKIRNNARFSAGNQSTRHFNNQEPMFTQDNGNVHYETTSFVHEEPLPASDGKSLGEISDYEASNNNYKQQNNEVIAPYSDSDSVEEHVPPQDDHNYYTYRADESYLNEEGRDSDHLYIGPGEPLTPKKIPPKFISGHVNGELSGTPVYEHTGDDNTDMNIPPSFATQNTNQNIDIEVVNTSKTKIIASSPAANFKNNTQPYAENQNLKSDSPYITPGAPVQHTQQQNTENNDSPYISPGAPKRFPSTRYVNPEQMDANSPYISPGSHRETIVEEKRDPDEPIYIVPGAEGARLAAQRKARLEKERQEKLLEERLRLEKERLNANREAQSAIDSNDANHGTTSDLYVGNNYNEHQDHTQEYVATSSKKIDRKAIFANVKNNMANGNNAKDTVDKANTPKKGISVFFLMMLSVRQIFASFFQYTSLGIVFSRQARSFFGPSKPIFMPIPYFAVGFVCALFVLYLSSYVKPGLLAELGIILFIILTGCDAFRGLGKLLEAYSQRKIDNYATAVVVIIFIGVLTTVLEYYLEEQQLDLSFCLTIGAVCLLSALCATSFNYGSKYDPISSFGTISLTGLIFAIFCSLLVTFTILQWQVAFSMIGICALVRLLIGQYICNRNISASTHIICAVQFITMFLLMLDLLIVSHAFEINAPLHFLVNYFKY